jgi:acyl-CoA thioester hydrolase
MFAIVSVNIDYLLPARLDDLLQITCTIMAEGRASFAFSQDVYRERVGGELLTRARTRAACLDCATLRPRRLPESLLQAIARHEG